MINILFIHQSAELYGSDKTLLLLLKHLDRAKFNPVVVLPSEGPLQIELQKHDIKVVVAPVLKLYRKIFTPKNIFLFFKEIKKAFSILDNLNNEYHFDIIYSNTLAVLLGMIYAKKRKIKHIWHVHEIIASPKIFKKSFSKLLSLDSTTKIVYNSIATQHFWNVSNTIKNKSKVIWNGLEIDENFISEQEKYSIRKNLLHADEEIVIALIGRISRWKGQQLLLKTFYELSKNFKNIKLLFVGSVPPNQEIFLENLKNNIEALALSEKVIILPFQQQIAKIWQSIDIAVVPSIEPEPFGLVAVEAMLAKKPVVASDHGGLSEIIINDETGFLVEPNNETALYEAICKLIANPEMRNSFGEKGFKRAVNEFGVENYTAQFENLFIEIEGIR
ncbi:MAG: glycosyltransferase family 4 protein [Flavobacterium sp.]|nr:glycosyltransferase family 4 protein [Flavobacterium sp.]